MKTMQNFAAQQLSKKQMNEVKGGMKVSCDLILDDGTLIDLGKQDNVEDFQAFTEQLAAAYQGIGDIECMPWIIN